MVTPDEFRAAFAEDGVVAFPASAVSLLPIAASDADWLREVGLPRSAAPFLSFADNDEINIPTVTDLWGVRGFSQYRVIGANGNGDPIAIDTANGEIVYLNHDNAFQRVFINSSVIKLAEALLACYRLIAEAQAANGHEAFLDGDIPPESLSKFLSLLETVDPVALKSGMWTDELERLNGSEEAE
jgi:hypothetical protein